MCVNNYEPAYTNQTKMKKLYLNTGGFSTIFNDLKDSFDGELAININNEYELAFKSKWAKGAIKGICFENKMTHINFDVVFNQDVSLSIESFESAPIFFAYCENGSISHSFGANGDKKIFKKNQTAIVSNTSAINNVLYFESHKHIQFSLIAMPTQFSDDENQFTVSQLKKKFLSESGNYIYIGAENVKLSEKWLELKALPQKGIVRNLLKKIILKEIIEMEIAQHSYNYLNTFDPIVNLATRQLHELKRISHLNFFEVMIAGKNYLPRIFREKYHFSLKPYNQKLAS